MTKKPGVARKYRELRGPLLLLAVPLLVFLQVGRHDFLAYDDPINIFQNPRITDFSLTNLLYFWQGPSLGLYIPLTYNFWMVIAKISQLATLGGTGASVDPQLFHLVNLLVHLGATILVFKIIGSLSNNSRAGLAGALLFAIHPVQVEPVAWASGMKDLLSGFWSLLALWQYLRYCKAAEKRCRTGHYLLATLALLLALLAKPGAVMVPVLAGLTGWLLLTRPWRQVFTELSPWLLVVLPLALVTTQVQVLDSHVHQPLFWQRFLVAGDAVSFYLAKLLLPVNLGPDYGRLPELVLARNWLYLTGAIPYILGGLLLWKSSRRWLAVAGLFLAPLLPVLGFLPFAFQEVSTVADRYLYLAMLGPALAAGLCWAKFAGKRVFRLGAAGLLTLLALLSIKQTGYWRNSATFSEHAIQVNPQSWNSHLRYGIAEYAANHRDEAVGAFTRALAIKPDFVDAYYGLGVVYWEQGQNDQALAYFNQAMSLDPANVPTALSLGDIYRKSGRYDLAIGYYRIAIASELDRAEFHLSLGECYAALGRTAEAIASFRQALAMQPDYAEAQARLAAMAQNR